MIKTLVTALLVTLLTPQAFAQDSGSDSNRIIQMDPSPVDEAAEDSEAQVNLSPLGAQTYVSQGQQRLGQRTFLFRGTLYSALGAIVGGLTGGAAALVLWASCGKDCASIGVVSAVPLAIAGGVFGAEQPARMTGGRCTLKSRLFGGASGAVASMIIAAGGSKLVDLYPSDRRPLIPAVVIGIIAVNTAPLLGATYGCYKTYRPNP